jgi:general secretion pathway protein K
MNISLPPAKRGIALIIVLIMITVLGILAGGFAYSMKVETTLARHATFSSDLDWAGRSGVEVAKWVLALGAQGPEGQVDSLKQKWAGGPGSTNDALADIDLKNYPLTGPDGSLRGTLSIEIKDLDRKFNINAAALSGDDMILKQALTLIGVDASESASIANSILDWVDRDNDPRMGGAESDDYQRMDPPYFAKNGLVDDLSELLLIKGVTPAMYWGSAAGDAAMRGVRRPNSARQSHFDEPIYAVGLVNLFTPVSSGRVNINTASADVLRLFFVPGAGLAIDDDMAQQIIKKRAGLDGQDGTEDDEPFRSPQEVAMVIPVGGPSPGANPQAQAQLARYFTTRSLVFEVTVTVNMGGNKRQCVALVRRNGPKDIQTLNLYWKS